MEDRARNNFDHPNSLDTDLLIHHLAELIEGRPVVVPRYDFKRHCRYQEGEIDDEGRSTGRIVESERIILVEGILIFSVKALVRLMDLKIFVVSSGSTASCASAHLVWIPSHPFSLEHPILGHSTTLAGCTE